jgi:hypothetical protein
MAFGGTTGNQNETSSGINDAEWFYRWVWFVIFNNFLRVQMIFRCTVA